jgi:aminoglycoside phosphotransferase
LVGPDAECWALLKVASSPSGRLELRRQSAALAEVHADDRLGEWRELVPRIVCAGDGAGGYYVVESRLSGRDARGALAGDGNRFVSAAVATITDLHRRTACPVLVDEDILDNWIHRPAAQVRVAIPARYRPVLDQLIETLATTLRGRLVAAGWRHGDYTADNILLDEHARVTGVVDWAQAERDGLLVTDVVTLLLATEAEAGGQQLGHVVQMWLDAVSPAALRTLTSVQRGLGGDQVDGRTLVLLGWLQMVSGNLAKSARYAANPVWMRHNVIAVLRAVAHSGEAASCRVP